MHISTGFPRRLFINSAAITAHSFYDIMLDNNNTKMSKMMSLSPKNSVQEERQTYILIYNRMLQLQKWMNKQSSAGAEKKLHL